MEQVDYPVPKKIKAEKPWVFGKCQGSISGNDYNKPKQRVEHKKECTQTSALNQLASPNRATPTEVANGRNIQETEERLLERNSLTNEMMSKNEKAVSKESNVQTQLGHALRDNDGKDDRPGLNTDDRLILLKSPNEEDDEATDDILNYDILDQTEEEGSDNDSYGSIEDLIYSEEEKQLMEKLTAMASKKT